MIRPLDFMRRVAPDPVKRLLAQQRFGSLRRVAPASEWGEERGTPVDRWYIDRFLEMHAALINGHALEVKNDLYARRFGASSVDIVDIDPANPRARIVGDLCKPGTLRPSTYDVAVVTQTLQFLEEPLEAVDHLLGSLRPGGTLLITVPTLSRVADASDRWRWTPKGLRELVTSAAPIGSEIECRGLGNCLAARAFLFGLSAQDLREDELNRPDEHYPLLVGATIRIPA